MSLHRYRDGSWWVRAGDWSLAYDPAGDDGWRPLSERYGTTRTWWLWRFELRRHGQLAPVITHGRVKSMHLLNDDGVTDLTPYLADTEEPTDG